MDNRKYQSDLSIEELLNALNSSEEKESAFISDPVFSFIQTFQIKEGKHKVKVIFLYDLFKKWNKRSRMTKAKFIIEFKKYFNTENRVNDRLTVMINSETIDLLKHLDTYSPNTQIIRYKKVYSHFEKFLTIKDIKKGDLYIESDVFYHIYDTWTYRNNIHQQLSYDRFILIAELYFDSKQFDGSQLIWFGVDESIKQHISVQAVNNWRQGRARRGKKSKVRKEDEDKIIYPETQEQTESG